MTAVQLRPYQLRVVNAVRSALNSGMKSPCASVATGGGKTWILTTLVDAFTRKGRRCLTLTHVKELIGQLDAAASQMIYEHGVYAAGLGRRESNKIYIIGQIQSCYKRMTELGVFDVIFVDECHLIGPDAEGMYQMAIADARLMNPNVRIVGLSATPFRMTEGFIYGPGKMFEACVEQVSMRELIDAGYLTPLVGKNCDLKFDASSLHMRGGDFVAGELEDFMADNVKVASAVGEMLLQCQDRKRVLVFSSGNKHSRMIVEQLTAAGQSAEWVSGEHTATERSAILERSRTGAIKYLVNCAILTTGYDDPAIDAIAMLRPTRSPGLLLQCAGRGLRLHPSKRSCLFLDFGGCLSHFGPLDTIETSIKARGVRDAGGQVPTKTCPECKTVLHAAKSVCFCGYEWKRGLNHEEEASDAAVMSGMRRVAVQRVSYSIQPGKAQSLPGTLRVTYWSGLFDKIAEEWLSVDVKAHPYARRKGLMWLRDTPTKEAEGKTLACDGHTIRGTKGGTTQDIVDVLSLLPYTACIESPTHVTVAPDPERPKYTRVYRREFK